MNDTGRPLLDDYWWGPQRERDESSRTQDLYLFGHGRRYTEALADFALVAGRVPLLPRYMLGVMYTRWLSSSLLPKMYISVLEEG